MLTNRHSHTLKVIVMCKRDIRSYCCNLREIVYELEKKGIYDQGEVKVELYMGGEISVDIYHF